MRVLVIEGLRIVLNSMKRSPKKTKIEPHVVTGQGAPDVSWNALASKAYENEKFTGK